MSEPMARFKRLPGGPDLPLPAYATAAAPRFELRMVEVGELDGTVRRKQEFGSTGVAWSSFCAGSWRSAAMPAQASLQSSRKNPGYGLFVSGRSDRNLPPDLTQWPLARLAPYIVVLLISLP